jgi:hypothetical protein
MRGRVATVSSQGAAERDQICRLGVSSCRCRMLPQRIPHSSASAPSPLVNMGEPHSEQKYCIRLRLAGSRYVSLRRPAEVEWHPILFENAGPFRRRLPSRSPQIGQLHSFTSSARARSQGGMAMPSALAALRDCGAPRVSTSVDRLDRQRDTLAATDAERDDAAPQAVAPHRMDEARGQNRAGGADRMAMGDGAALDVDDVRREA